MFSNSTMLGLYQLFRLLTVAGAMVWVFSSLSCELFLPALCYDVGPVPPESVRLKNVVIAVVVAAVLVLPYRWTVRPLLYWIRLSVLFVIGLVLLYAAATGVWGFLAGRKHWLIVPTAGAMLLLAVALPASLVLARRMKQAATPN